MKGLFVFLCLQVIYQVKAQWVSTESLQNGKKYHWSSQMKTWENANAECSKNGWNLAHVLGPENKVFKDFIRTTGKSTWIGLKLTEIGSGTPTGRWSDGTIFTNNNFSDWAQNQPESTWQCVMLWDEKNYEWDNHDCTSEKHFVCETHGGSLSNEEFIQDGEMIINNTQTLNSSEENLIAISNAMNELLGGDLDWFSDNANLSRRIIYGYEDFVERYKDGNYSNSTENLDVNIVLPDDNSTLRFGEEGRKSGSIQMELSSVLMQETRELMKNFTNGTRLQIGSVIYKNTGLFQPDQKRYDKKQKDDNNTTCKVRVIDSSFFGEEPQILLPQRLLSNVMSVQVTNVTMSHLKNTVEVSADSIYPDLGSVPNFTDMKVIPSLRCAYWDNAVNDWSHTGCVTTLVPDDGNMGNKSVICNCNHMTNFAIMLSTSYRYSPNYLDALTMTGCSISAIFHLATIVTISCFRHMRVNTNKRIILNISISLFAVNVIFVAGIEREVNDDLCHAVSLMLHYFLLTAWMWMLLEAVYLFLALFLKQLGAVNDTKFLLAGGILAYGLPAIAAALTMTLSDPYLSLRYCWLSPSIINYAVAAPIGTFLVINLFVLVVATYAITCGTKLRSTVSNAEAIQRTIRRILYMIFLLGIPWIFCFLTLLVQHPEAKNVFSVLFIVFNMLQGFVTYLAFAASDEKMRAKFCFCAGGIRSTAYDIFQSLPGNKNSFDVEKASGGANSTTMESPIKTIPSGGTNAEHASGDRQSRKKFRSGWH